MINDDDFGAKTVMLITGWMSYLLTTGLILSFDAWAVSRFFMSSSVLEIVSVLFAAAMFTLVWTWISVVLWKSPPDHLNGDI